MKNGIVKIIVCVGISVAITALCLADPFIGAMTLISGGLIMWGILSS